MRFDRELATGLFFNVGYALEGKRDFAVSDVSVHFPTAPRGFVGAYLTQIWSENGWVKRYDNGRWGVTKKGSDYLRRARGFGSSNMTYEPKTVEEPERELFCDLIEEFATELKDE